jgi:hypothetical protein
MLTPDAADQADRVLASAFGTAQRDRMLAMYATARPDLANDAVRLGTEIMTDERYVVPTNRVVAAQASHAPVFRSRYDGCLRRVPDDVHDRLRLKPDRRRGATPPQTRGPRFTEPLRHQNPIYGRRTRGPATEVAAARPLRPVAKSGPGLAGGGPSSRRARWNRAPRRTSDTDRAWMTTRLAIVGWWAA